MKAEFVGFSNRLPRAESELTKTVGTAAGAFRRKHNDWLVAAPTLCRLRRCFRFSGVQGKSRQARRIVRVDYIDVDVAEPYPTMPDI